MLRTPSGRVELAPPPIVADVERLRASLGRQANGGLVLVGRRQLRSNNSWMHNLPVLVKGKERRTLHVHPDDAAEAAALSVAAGHAGTNSNAVADEALVDALSGNAVLNGIPVEVTAAARR